MMPAKLEVLDFGPWTQVLGPCHWKLSPCPCSCPWASSPC